MARKSTKLSVHGKTVVLTGTVPGMERAAVEARLVGLGATCRSAVSKQTDYLFAMADAGSKVAEAERLGIPVLGEVVLFSLIGLPDAPRSPPVPVTVEAKAKVAARKPRKAAGFAGKTCVITGTLSKGRAEIAAMLEAAGATVTGSVSANTQFLIAGAGVGAAKISKATALGVTVIDEATMTAMLAGRRAR
jgi:DNA ligase (NAD+)